MKARSKEELRHMRAAGRVVAEMHEKIRAAIRPGVTTADLDAIGRKVIDNRGATSNFLGYHGFPAVICASPNDVIVHGIPGAVVLNEGDIISVDCGAVVEGWHGDAAFTTGVGEISAEAAKLISVTDASLAAGIAALLSLGYYGSATSADGSGYELNVIAAAVVGGASLTGGRGTALGALLGALIIQLISSGIVILGIDQNYSQIIIGAVVILAVLLDQTNRWLSSRRR